MITKKISQRDRGFNGGIKSGTTAFDEQSKRLDKLLKETRDSVSLPGFTCVKQFTTQMKIDLLGDDCFGFAPDGGAWLYKGKLVAVFEGKKQNKGGNAQERWYDNATTAKYINPDVKYVTFCSGEGAYEGECLDKMRRKAQIVLGENYIFYMSPNGFTREEVTKIISDTLRSCI